MMSLSIVFPAYDEESKIENDIRNAVDFLSSNDIKGEIIIVDDGSHDRTYQIAAGLKDSITTDIEIIRHDKNLGKGFAVRSGIMIANCDFILYSDMGDIVPFNYALKGMKILNEKNIEIAHGSRKLPESVITKEQDSDRKVASWIFNKLLLKFMNIPGHLTDTQCGFKIYKSEIAKELYKDLKVGGFLFELEIIKRALKQHYKIAEFPVEWKCDRDSRISLSKTTPEVLKEIFYLKSLKI